MIFNYLSLQNERFQLSDDVAETDSPYKIPERLYEVNDKAAEAIQNVNKHTEKQLKRWIAENPGLPQLKNYLTVYYSKKGQLQKAFQYNHEIAARHPNYLFAKINLALESLTHEEPDKVLAVLGPSLDLRTLYPERTVFHISEYTGFYKIAVRYFEMTDQLDKAQTVLEDLEKLEEELDDDFDLDELQSLLMIAGFKDMTDELAKKAAFEPTVRQEPTLPQIEEGPGFHFPQIQWLYQNSFAIGKTKVAELLGLERGPLINDLAAVVRDAIQRYEYFLEEDYKPETHDFIVHALLLLQQLEAHEALPAVLEFLRQPEELLDYWLGDLITESTWQVVYATGKTDLAALEAFLKEPLNHTFARAAVSEAIGQSVLHHPERKADVIELYRRLLRFYYENKGNLEVNDYTLNSFIIGDIVDFNGKELTGEMKLLYEEGMVDESIQGEWKDVLERLNTDEPNPEFSGKMELQDIYTIMQELHQAEVEAATVEEDDEDENEDAYFDEDDGFTDYEEVNTDGGTLLYSGNEPYRREEKIGRNDPCPCGSGMKYKKCHGRND